MEPGSDRQRRFAPPASLARLERAAWGLGAAGAVACVLGAVTSPQAFTRSYLVGWLFWWSIALGCLGLAMLHHLSRGAWGLMVRRILEASARTLPALAVLFLPVAFGLEHLYVWMDSARVAADPVLQHKGQWLNETGVLARSALYFVVWCGLAWALTRFSARQDRDSPGAATTYFRRMRIVAGPGMVLYVLTLTLASVDWVMSLDPHWYSSIFGIYLLGGQGIAALAFMIVVALYLARRQPMDGVLRGQHFHDYGKLLLAFVMLWAYFAISQYLIIWSGNLPEEIGWFLERRSGGWQFVALALGVLHFAAPFLLLLSRNLKRDARRLALVALLLLAVHWLDLTWLVMPAFRHQAWAVHWLDLATLVGIGGIWLGLFLRLLARRPLLPLQDPFLEEALGHG